MGDVSLPGAYQVSSVATVFNALYNAGGPGEQGSMRSIEVRRGGGLVADEELATPDEKAIPTGIEKVTLLNTSVVRLPYPIADAIKEERIEEVLAFLKAEIMVLDPEAKVALDRERPVVRMVGSD
jgi:hypothetical protein